MIFEFLAASGVLFWGLLSALFLLIAWPLSKDEQIFGLVLAIIFALGVILFTDAPARVSPFWLAMLIPLYLSIGIAWALHKWRGYLLERKAEIKAELATRANAYPGMTDERVMAERRPSASRNKERITGWIALWPWSMSWVVLKFPWRVVVWTYDQMANIFERMSEKIWAS